MDCSKSFELSKVQLEMIHNEPDGFIHERSHSNSSRTSDLSRDSAVSSIFQIDSPLQPKLDADSTRIHSSSRGSPQIRLSGVLENHDPNRIPLSIFSSKPSSPMEWSTASNESLFSIHVGNNSFSREQFNFYTKSGELTNNTNSTQNLSSSPPFVDPARVESKTEIVVNVFPEQAASTGAQIPAISTQSVTNRRKEVIISVDDHRSRPSESNDSMNSSRSFQFPLLGGEGATPKSNRSVSTDSCTQQKQHQPGTKSTKLQSLEHQSASNETTSSSRTMNFGSGWFSCLSWCRCR